jgi:hypothetical protein
MDYLVHYKHLPNFVRKTIGYIGNFKLDIFQPSNSLIDLILALIDLHPNEKSIQTLSVKLFEHELSYTLVLKRI